MFKQFVCYKSSTDALLCSVFVGVFLFCVYKTSFNSQVIILPFILFNLLCDLFSISLEFSQILFQLFSFHNLNLNFNAMNERGEL